MEVTYSSRHTGDLPVLGVTAAEDNFDDNLVLAGFRDVAVDDVDLRANGDESFLHFVLYGKEWIRDEEW
jgi:hypothetical protein